LVRPERLDSHAKSALWADFVFLFTRYFERVSSMRTVMNIPHSFSRMFLFSACILAGSGCGGNDKVVSVSGKVTHNGNPVPGLVVSFVPQSATVAGVSTGTTDDQGQYTLTVFKTGDRGAVVGAHKVWVSLPRQPESDDKETRNKAARNAGAGMTADTAVILRKYGRLETTPLTVEVTGDELDLKLD
jgi:hypothetical protein